jgi:hypothetical protein
MNKLFFHLFDSNNKFYKFSYIPIVFFYVYYAFKFNEYEIIFMDERVIIDDIYDIWLLDDAYGRYSDVKNSILKNFLILVTEVSYGGDLRYGRLWSNIFTLFIGPFTFFGDTLVITISRIFNILLYFISIWILSELFIKKTYRWFFLLAMYSLPGVDTLHRFPKPEVVALLFTVIALYFLKKNEYFKTIFFLGIASFVKINFGLFSLLIFIRLLINSSEKLTFTIKSGLIGILSMVIVNPILLIPPVKFENFELPNFYKNYLNWLLSQGSYGQEEFFSISYASGWIREIGRVFDIPIRLSGIFVLLIIILALYAGINALNAEDEISVLFIVSFFTYFIFYLFFIERSFIWYLNFPFILLVISIFRNVKKNSSNRLIIILILLVLGGLVGNINRHYSDKKFVANYELGYENISSSEDAILQIDLVINKLQDLYEENPQFDKKLVFWNPNLFLPRQGVTYSNTFYVRENWGSNIDEILLTSDFYVTNENIDSINVKSESIGNYIIYFK